MSTFQISKVQTEYTTEPLGISEPSPRFTWRIDTDAGNWRQEACQVRITLEDGSEVWDSGQLAQTEQRVEYRGPALLSATRYLLTVTVISAGHSETSLATWFETGLLDQTEWKADWIQGRLVGGRRAMVPAPYFRRSFAVESEVVRARLYITALGVMDPSLNGQPLGTDELSPGWTDYRKRVRYLTYDVTEHLQQGENVLGVAVGDGWYAGNVEWRGRQLYGDRPALLAQLVVETEDGRVEVVTNGDWQHNYGPIVQADILMGEHHDYRLSLPGWDAPGFDDSNWLPVETIEPNVGALVAYNCPPIRSVETLQPVSVKRIPTWPSDIYLVDFGQNLVGRVRLKVSGKRGDTIRIRFGEKLDNNGNLYTENLRSATQTDFVTLSGDGVEIFEPKFTFHGFQYCEIQNFPGEFSTENIEAVVLHTDYEMPGDFSCSDPLLTQLWKNIRWGWRGNSVDVPTDCPQRDERLGWTGDAQVFVRTALTIANTQSFWEKYQVDLADSQSPQGKIPPTAPDTAIFEDSDGGPAWSDALLICPWTVYQATGDARILERHFASFEAYFRSLDRAAIDDIRSHPNQPGFLGFGDWLSINADTPIELIGTAFYARSADLMAKICRVVGREDRVEHYETRFREIREAFLRRFVTADGFILSGTQTAYVLALHFDLLPEDLHAAAVEALVTDIGKRGYKLSTGFVGSPYLNHVLLNNGRADVAFKLLHQTQWPSWLYAVTQGATTIWERWDGWTHDKGFQDKGMNSFNHYAYGAIGDWMMQKLAGIDLAAPGFAKIRLQPHIGGNLTSVTASQDTPFGLVHSGWEVSEGTVTWNFVVPPNTTAEIHPPTEGGTLNGAPFDGAEVGSGRYTFVDNLPS
jgi:alpha-L-rhamnosidase